MKAVFVVMLVLAVLAAFANAEADAHGGLDIDGRPAGAQEGGREGEWRPREENQEREGERERE